MIFLVVFSLFSRFFSFFFLIFFSHFSLLGLDHTQILGNTIEEIAEKKVGIFKDHQISLIGPTVPLKIAQDFSSKLKNHELISHFDIEKRLFQIKNQNLQQILLKLWQKSEKNVEKMNEFLTFFSLFLLNEKFPNLFNLSQYVSENEEKFLSILEENAPCRWEHFYVKKDGEKSLLGSVSEGEREEEEKKVLFILDMGHNHSALENLLNKFDREYPNNRLR